MTKAAYAEERRDPRWQKKRLEIMQRDGFKCFDCGESTNTLAVHHAYYVKGRKCWDYPSFALSTLCADCHAYRHSEKVLYEDEEPSPIDPWEQIVDFIFGDTLRDADDAWDFACKIAQASKHYPRRTVFAVIARGIEPLTEARAK